MKITDSSVPTTGRVLEFLVECFGTGKDKGVGRSKEMEGSKRNGPDWAQYKRVERLANQYQQSRLVSREVEDQLIDAVAAVFDPSFKGGIETPKIRGMKLVERIQFALSPSYEQIEPRFTMGLVFWIVYFIEHHEWLRPQLEAAHAPDAALWQWVQQATQLYTNTLANTFSANSWLFAGLPNNLSWNLPSKQPNGTVKWPMCCAVDWLASLLNARDREQLPSILYPYPNKSYSAKCFSRLMRGTHLPNLTNIERWAEHPWQYKDATTVISLEKLKAVLLWCRALQYSLKAVEKRFNLDAVWLLVDWHNKAVTSRQIRFVAPRP